MKNPFKATLDSRVIYSNDQIGLAHDACKICWDKPAEEGSQAMLNYIQKRISSGHESVIEHTNIIMLISTSIGSYKNELLEIIALCKYLGVSVKYDSKENLAYILIGGSIRGYKHIFRNITNMTNPILAKIKDNLYDSSYPEFFADFIEAGIMDERNFRVEEYRFKQLYRTTTDPSDKLEVVNIDPIHSIYNELQESIGDIFTYSDLLGVCSVTVLFKDMSRTATHQLVRHRNAITQESQRYVDYSNAKFVSPDQYNDEYKDIHYNINIFDKEVSVTMEELGKELMKIYHQLREQDVKKQDARAFLPSNVACNKLYMTFTYKNLIKFLELRTDLAAQSEIRNYAEILLKEFADYTEDVLGGIYKYLLPTYLLSEVDYDYSKIDEVLEVIDE